MAAGDVLWSAYGTADDLSNSNAFAVADGTAVLSPEVDNSTDLKMFGDLEVSLDATVTSVGADARIEVYMIPAYDGTNYPTPGTTTTFTATQYVGAISAVEVLGTPGATPFQQGTLRKIELPPCKFKLITLNELGVTMVGRTVTLKLRRYSPKVAQS